jgi:hypothetical protein
MAFRAKKSVLLVSAVAVAGAMSVAQGAIAQVFVVGEKTATADISTDFKPTRIELPSKPINELGRRQLVRDLEAEQGFAHRALPMGGEGLTLLANGVLNPGGEAYREMIYKKGQSAAAGDRVVITTVTVKPDRIIFDLNGGPFLKHRFLRHIELNNTPIVQGDVGEQATGSRVTLLFEGGLPDIGAPEVKALLNPIIDFGVKTGAQAYADTLPDPVKQAVAKHDILVGMNKRTVIAAAGAPENKERELLPGSTDKHYEEWIYGHMPQTVRFVRFEGDRVTQVRIAALGKPIEVHDKDEMGDYVDPDGTREVALGDGPVSSDPDQPKAAPPTLRRPGDPEPEGPGAMHRVQYPPPAKTTPVPAVPATDNSPNDDSSPGTAAPSSKP